MLFVLFFLQLMLAIVIILVKSRKNISFYGDSFSHFQKIAKVFDLMVRPLFT